VSNKKDTGIFRHSSKATSPWDAAIKDAEQMIAEAKKRIAILRNAIRGFETLRDEGHPWPGTFESSEGTYESTPTSGAKPNHRILSAQWILRWHLGIQWHR